MSLWNKVFSYNLGADFNCAMNQQNFNQYLEGYIDPLGVKYL